MKPTGFESGLCIGSASSFHRQPTNINLLMTDLSLTTHYRLSLTGHPGFDCGFSGLPTMPERNESDVRPFSVAVSPDTLRRSDLLSLAGQGDDDFRGHIRSICICDMWLWVKTQETPGERIKIGGKWMFIHPRMEPQVMPHGHVTEIYARLSPSSASNVACPTGEVCPT